MFEQDSACNGGHLWVDSDASANSCYLSDYQCVVSNAADRNLKFTYMETVRHCCHKCSTPPWSFLSSPLTTLIDWLTNRPTDWLPVWLPDQLTDFLSDWLIDWNDWSMEVIDWLIDWMIDWLIELIGWLWKSKA